MDGDIYRLSLHDVVEGTGAAQAAGNYQAVLDHLDAYACASPDFEPIVSKELAAQADVHRLARAGSIALWLLNTGINHAYATQLFFRLANAVGPVIDAADLDDATAAAQIRVHAGDRPVTAKVETALFVALALRRPSVFEDAARALLSDGSIPLETRLALASGVTTLYWNIWKANKPPQYDGILPELHAAYFIPNRRRFEFCSEIAERAGAEFAAEVSKHGFIQRRPLHPPQLRICFLVEDLGNHPLNTTTKLIVDYAYLLTSKMGNVSVDIVVAKNHWPHDQYSLLGVHSGSYASLVSLLEAYGFGDEPLREKRLTLSYLDAPTQGGYVQRFVDALAGIQPDCIVSFPVPYFTLEQVFYNNFPVVAVELVNGMLSSTWVDVLIPNGTPNATTIARYGEKLVLTPLPAVPFVARENYTRESLGYPARGAGIVIATVGINFERRMRMLPDHDEYWQGVAETLRAYPHAIWQLVGINPDGEANILSECPELRQHLDSGRLRFKDYETDLRAFLQCCDIYASPPIPGAGRGAELAACCALPILGYPYNDAANFLPENQVHDSHGKYFAALAGLIENPELRQELGAANSRILGDDYFSYAAQGLLYAALKAIDRYNERQGLGIAPRED